MGLVVKNKAKKDVQQEIEEFFSEVGLETIKSYKNHIFYSESWKKFRFHWLAMEIHGRLQTKKRGQIKQREENRR